MTNSENRPGTRGAYLAWLATLAVGSSLAVAWLWAQPQGALPEPLAGHWGLVSGLPDGALSRAALTTIALALGPGCAAAAAVAGYQDAAAEERPQLLALSAFLAALGATMTYGIVRLNAGASRWQQAHPNSLWLTIGALALLAAGAWLTHYWAERAWLPASPTDPKPPQALQLAPDERVYWTGSASNRWLALVAGILAAGVLASGLPLTAGAPRYSGLFPLCAALLVEATSKATLRLDHRVLQIRLGHLGLLRQTIALPHMQKAMAVCVRPLSLGGWGYRGVPYLSKRIAIVIRGGEALQLTLVGGRRLTVTVDDADTAARVVNGLIQRETRAPAPNKGAEVIPSP